MLYLYLKQKVIFNGLKILSPEDTLDEIIKKNKSISRFGDGEFELIFGNGIGFQKANKILTQKLKEVIKSKKKGLLVGINIPYNNYYLNKYTYKSKKYFINWIEKRKIGLFT